MRTTTVYSFDSILGNVFFRSEGNAMDFARTYDPNQYFSNTDLRACKLYHESSFFTDIDAHLDSSTSVYVHPHTGDVYTESAAMELADVSCYIATNKGQTLSSYMDEASLWLNLIPASLTLSESEYRYVDMVRTTGKNSLCCRVNLEPNTNGYRDPSRKIMFVDSHWKNASTGRARVKMTGDFSTYGFVNGNMVLSDYPTYEMLAKHFDAQTAVKYRNADICFWEGDGGARFITFEQYGYYSAKRLGTMYNDIGNREVAFMDKDGNFKTENRAPAGCANLQHCIPVHDFFTYAMMGIDSYTFINKYFMDIGCEMTLSPAIGGFKESTPLSRALAIGVIKLYHITELDMVHKFIMPDDVCHLMKEAQKDMASFLALMDDVKAYNDKSYQQYLGKKVSISA